MDPRYGAARGWVDRIIDPAQTREELTYALELATRHASDEPFRVGVYQVWGFVCQLESECPANGWNSTARSTLVRSFRSRQISISRSCRPHRRSNQLHGTC